MTAPKVTHWFQQRVPDNLGSTSTSSSWVLWNSINGAPSLGESLYLLVMGEITSVTPDAAWALAESGSVGASHWWLYHRVGTSSETGIETVTFSPINTAFIWLAVGANTSLNDVVGSGVTNTGDDCNTGNVAVPAGEISSVHMWAGKPVVNGSWVPPSGTFDGTHKQVTAAGGSRTFTGSIGVIGYVNGGSTSDVYSGANPSVGIDAPSSSAGGGDNVGVQILFSSSAAVGSGWTLGIPFG